MIWIAAFAVWYGTMGLALFGLAVATPGGPQWQAFQLDFAFSLDSARGRYGDLFIATVMVVSIACWPLALIGKQP